MLKAVILWGLYQRLPRLALPTASGVAVFYSAVVAWNLSVLFMVR